jgi:hypothetical protein
MLTRTRIKIEPKTVLFMGGGLLLGQDFGAELIAGVSPGSQCAYPALDLTGSLALVPLGYFDVRKLAIPCFKLAVAVFVVVVEQEDHAGILPPAITLDIDL